MFTQARCVAVLLAGASLLAGCAIVPVAPSPPLVAPVVSVPAPAVPVATLAAQIDIPHTSFTLANGLTVIVHEDHKAPIVAVSTWYNVGSKDEPAGKTGFAHLFEHLMFNGSENLPGDYFTWLQKIGATDYNGTTWFDRTNYFETVPRAAIDRALFMESDRMGYLLGAITPKVLDNQRAVVQNEKRQGDNQPGGLTQYEQLDALFPDGHPYRHPTIGSMVDLDAASLADVKDWFRSKYGPNNAVLVLAGDVTAAEARPLVERYFGSIARGPVNIPAAAAVPTLAAARTIVMKDRVATTQIELDWVVPGLADPDLTSLDLGTAILGGLASSRLDNALVRGDRIAVSVSAEVQPFQRISLLSVNATVKPGVDPALVERRLHEVIAQLIADGPTQAEVQRAATRELASRVRGLEQVGGFGGKAVALAEGQVLAGDSDLYRRQLDRIGAATPGSIRAALAHWLDRPALTIRLEPGERPPYVETKFVAAKIVAGRPTVGVKRALPPIGVSRPLEFPAVSHVQLSNGIPLDFAQRGGVPVTQLALSFDAGTAADPASAHGLQNLTLSLLDQGAGGLGAQALAEENERLGASISAGGSQDRSSVGLSSLSANLAPSLDLLARIIRQPDFAPADIERVRSQIAAAIAEAQKDPASIAARILPGALYGEGHPYAGTVLGDPAAVAHFTRDDIVAFRDRWFRPDNLRIFVVSDRPLAEIQPLIEARFGTWAAPATARGSKAFTLPRPRPTRPRIILVDRPGSPQSLIYGGQITPVDPASDITDLTQANDVLGGNFLSRINMDLREVKGWSYGAGGGPSANEHLVAYTLRAPVQADRTGDAIAAIDRQLRGFLGANGVTADELERTVTNSISALPGEFETAGAVLGAMQANALYHRPDDYYVRLADRYRAETRASLDAAMRAAIDPAGFTWVVVGDAAKVRPQLDKLGYAIDVVQPK